MSYELTAELLNFGAFLGFMGVNIAVIWQFWIRRSEGHRRNFLFDLLLPAAGFVFCAIIWIGLNRPAKIAGSIWLAIGVLVLAAHTERFRKPMVMTDPSAYE